PSTRIVPVSNLLSFPFHKCSTAVLEASLFLDDAVEHLVENRAFVCAYAQQIAGGNVRIAKDLELHARDVGALRHRADDLLESLDLTFINRRVACSALVPREGHEQRLFRKVGVANCFAK